MRILTTFTIYGSQKALQTILDDQNNANLSLRQIGLKRKDPPLDEWCLNTPYFELSSSCFAEELDGFLRYIERVTTAFKWRKNDVDHATLYVIPVRGSDTDAEFACLMNPDSLRILGEIGCYLEVAPEATMPQANPVPKRNS